MFIRRVRKRARLSQTDLAELLGVTQSSVSQWERATATPDGAHLLDFLLKLAPASITVLANLAEQHAASTARQAPPVPHPDSL